MNIKKFEAYTCTLVALVLILVVAMVYIVHNPIKDTEDTKTITILAIGFYLVVYWIALIGGGYLVSETRELKKKNNSLHKELSIEKNNKFYYKGKVESLYREQKSCIRKGIEEVKFRCEEEVEEFIESNEQKNNKLINDLYLNYNEFKTIFEQYKLGDTIFYKVDGHTQRLKIKRITAKWDTIEGVKLFYDIEGYVFCLNSKKNGLIHTTKNFKDVPKELIYKTEEEYNLYEKAINQKKNEETCSKNK